MIRHLALAGAIAALMSTTAIAQAPAPMPAPTQQAAPAAEPQAAPPMQSAPQPVDVDKVPADSEACIKAATDLMLSVDEKKLAEDKLDKIDDLLARMETHCDAKQFVEAMAVARDIKQVIGAN